MRRPAHWKRALPTGILDPGYNRSLITNQHSPGSQGLGAGVGRGLGDGPDLGVGVGLGVAVGVAVAVGVGVGLPVGDTRTK